MLEKAGLLSAPIQFISKEVGFMKARKATGLFLVLALAAGLAGCGGDEDNGNGGKIFKATVMDRRSRTPLPGKTCRAVDNDEGTPITGFEFVSGAGGAVELEDLPGDLVGFHCDGVASDNEEVTLFSL